MTEAPPVLVCGISGWFTPHGTLYHQDRRSLDEIAVEDWAALLAHAEAIGFFTRAEPEPAPPEARIFHLWITDGERARELAINDPFEAPELALLYLLTRRALRDRQVLTPESMNDQQIAALRATLASMSEPGIDNEE
jgi:hypothetical protein